MAQTADFKLRLGLEGHALIVTGINQLIDLVGRAYRFMAKQAKEQQEYTRVIQGHTVAIGEADRATAGLIDTIEIHRQAALLEQAGLRVSEQQYAALSVAALDFARATGQDATESMERLTQAVISGEAEGLRRYGFTLEQGLTLEQRRIEVIRQITERVDGQTRKVQDLGEAFQRLENSAGTAWSELMRSITREGSPVMTLLERMADEADRLARNLAAASRTDDLAGAGSQEARLAQLQRQMVERGIDPTTGQTHATRAESLGGVARGYASVVTSPFSRGGLSAYERENREMAREAAQLARQIRRDPEAARESTRRAAAGLESRRRSERGTEDRDVGGGGGGGGRSAADREREAEQEQRRRRDAAERQLDLQEQMRERTLAAERSLQDDILDVERERLEASISQLEKAEEERMRLVERETRERQRIAEEEEAREQDGETERRRRIDATAQGLQDAAGMVRDFGSALTEMAGDHEAATKAIAAVEGAFQVAYNIVKAITDFSDAATAIAKQDYVTGALHIIAGAGHVTAAITAGMRLGASLAGVGEAQGKTPTGGRGGRTSRPEYYAPADRTPQGERHTVINFNGPVTSRRAQEDLRRLRADDARRND